MRGAGNILNGLKYKGKLGGSKITFIHRGLPGDKKLIEGPLVTEVKQGHFNYLSEEGGTTIPNDRILEIVSEGKVLWRKRIKA